MDKDLILQIVTGLNTQIRRTRKTRKTRIAEAREERDRITKERERQYAETKTLKPKDERR
jgi:vacuolar-type H+-ATPase subunit H